VNSGGYEEGNKLNRLLVSKIGDKVFFSINGGLAHVEDADNLPKFGDKIGMVIWRENKEIALTSLEIRVGSGSRRTRSESSSWTGSGTGFFVDSRGFIVTNHHVVENAKAVQIDVMQEGELRSFTATVLAEDKQNDLAILKIEGEGFKGLGRIPFGINFNSVDVGTTVFTLGFPETQILGSELKFTDGKISSRTGFKGDVTSYQISVPVHPGNSGGPLFDEDGNLVGIIKSGVPSLDSVNYAVKSIYLAALIDSLSVKLNLPKENSTVSMKSVDRIRALREFVVVVKVRE